MMNWRLCILVATVLSGLALLGDGRRSGSLVLHLDFNTLQHRQDEIVSILEQAAADGYTAVLWEIENKVRFDCCPEIAAPDAFTKEEFREILRTAKRLGLEPIPLMQTLGHAEYVLTHARYQAWREIQSCNSCYCPKNPEVVGFLKRLLLEYLELFGSDVKRMHLGGDEVWQMGKCPKCSACDRLSLYTEHLNVFADLLRQRGIRPGCWHDMALQLGEKRGASALGAFSDFTIWFWDYAYPSKGHPWGQSDEPIRKFGQAGCETIICGSSQSWKDDPFLVRYGFHRQNLAACADLARKGGISGLCVTSWTIHQGLKRLQMPLYGFVAKRYLNPGEDAEKDWQDMVRRQFGSLSVEALDEVSRWEVRYGQADGRGWNGGKDGSVPSRDGLLARFENGREGMERLAAELEDEARRTKRALAVLSGVAQEDLTTDGRLLVEGAKLRLRLLQTEVNGLRGEQWQTIPYDRTVAFYRKVYPQWSAMRAADIVWAYYLETNDCQAVHALVPMPRKVEWATGTCADTVQVVERSDPSIPAEGYRLDVKPGTISLAASGLAGFFYGRQTLRQLKEGRTYPCCRIFDSPAYSWRGLHLDVARHFFGKETVLKLLETMAKFKLNVLHLHLVDNQGWRIPIPGYSKLTEAMRPVENRMNFCDLSKTGTYGPYSYAKTDLQEIVRCARRKNIRIVPEIEIPGHSETVLKMYPEFACAVTNREVNNAVCVGKDETIRFFERVLDEVCDVFPDAVVHVGGDECDRRDWKRCPDCQARMKREGLADVAELQSWTTAHFERYLREKGRRLMGWDEIAEGGLPPGTMVMSWRGTSTGIMAAKEGQDVVMAPNEYCYFDYDQGIEGDPHLYPYNWTVLLPLAKVYAFDPSRGIPAEFRKHILGAQGNNWSEMIRTEDELEWKVWPRAAALAEVLWTYPANRDFVSFLQRMEARRKELIDSGVNAAPLEMRVNASRLRGELVRTRTENGETLCYVCGDVASTLTLCEGHLKFTSSGNARYEFKRNEFREIEVVAVGVGAYLVTARRSKRSSLVTVLFDGDRIVFKDTGDCKEDK